MKTKADEKDFIKVKGNDFEEVIPVNLIPLVQPKQA